MISKVEETAKTEVIFERSQERKSAVHSKHGSVRSSQANQLAVPSPKITVSALPKEPEDVADDLKGVGNLNEMITKAV